MEIKGELKRNGLPSLFRNFANENFHGVLTVTSDVGEKLITLTENEVTIYCDEMNEASRRGNILLGRNLVTEEVLDATLQDQRKLEPRPKLGDMLVMRGLVTEKAISDARRFQIEEDICDILSWKKTRFNFAGSDSAREIHPEDFAPEQVHRLTIDPDTFFKFVAKVTEEWDAIGDRLPTQYLCFKLSQKVDESFSKLSAESQRVLRYLKEGRTVEGVVKQSCLGRIEVCVLVIDLLERGLVLPTSGADLRFMASEHRAQKRYHDALYIYRRLLESPDSKDDRPYLENLIEEICEQIVRMKQSGAYGEEAIIYSHRDAREKYVQGKRRTTFMLAAAALALVCGAGFFFINKNKPVEDLPQRYRETVTRVDTLVASGKFNAAIKELDALYDSLPDKEAHAASGIQARKERIPGQIQNYIESKLPVLERMAQQGGEEGEKGIHELRELNEEYPQNANAQKIRDLIARYEEKKVEPKEPIAEIKPVGPVISRDDLMARLQKADALKQQGKFGDAKREYVTVTQLAPANGDVWKMGNEGAKSVEEFEDRVRDQIDQAVAAQKAMQGEKALVMLDKVLEIVGDLDDLSRAQKLKNFLLARKSQAEQLLKRAREFEDKNRVFEARDCYEQVAENYAEFPLSADARVKAAALKIKADALRKKLLEALDAVAKGDLKRARELYRPLLQFNEQMLIDQHVDLPVWISSIPIGSLLKVNGRTIGPTPKDVFLTAGTEYEIVVERPGYTPRKIAGDRIRDHDLEISAHLELDPVVIDLPPWSPGRAQSALLAPPIWFENRLLILNGPDLVALDPPGKDIKWKVPGLYDPRAPVPDGAALDDKNYWNCLIAPMSYSPGHLLLPLRNREVLDINVSLPEKTSQRSIFSRLSTPPPEITGNIYVEEHSKLAGHSILVAPFADGQVRCFEDFDKDIKYFNPRWSLPLDPQDALRRERPAAGLYGHKGLVWVLSGGGMLQAFDPILSEAVFKKEYKLMSARSAFPTDPGDSLAALVQRNGKLILFDLDHRLEVWTLPERAAMEEAVGVLIDASGIFVSTRGNNFDELLKYPRVAGIDGRAPQAECSVKLDGFVSLEMTSAKHIYVVTQGKVFAFSKLNLSQIWEYKLKPDMGEPRSIRAFGDNVYVLTDKGKLIVLKAE